MTPERYKEVGQLYRAALEMTSGRRAAFLAEACGSDDALRRDVESLLEYGARVGGVLDRPAIEVAAQALLGYPTSYRIGQSFGHYRIVSLLGKGGMGEVYLAEDALLKRKVALKLLPAVFTMDADRVRRFAQEARAASALNHPNIITIHEIGETSIDGVVVHYIVTEYVEGETLRQRMTDTGERRISLAEAINVAAQIAAALSAAHQAGITHRDIKPENVMLRRDGYVKVLDFGLAKLTEKGRNGAIDQGGEYVSLESPPSCSTPIPVSSTLTDAGIVMGTLRYMSPEQARGEKVDVRTDIFSLGIILYEMVSGQRAFTGDSADDVLNAILMEEPPELSETNAKVSPALEKIVKRCMEKRPERRFQSASDLGFALEALSAASSSSAGSSKTLVGSNVEPARRWRERSWVITSAVMTLIALGLGAAYLNRPSTDLRAARLAFVPPQNLAFDNGIEDYVIVSPDGKTLVFTGRSTDGKRQLWVRPLDGLDARPLPDTEDAQNPFWAPDSRAIGFGSRGKLKRVELVGGRSKNLCDVSDLRGGSWNRDGVILFALNFGGGLYQVLATGGEARQVSRPDPARRELHYLYPCFLPDGRRFIYRVIGIDGVHKIFAGSLDSKEVKELLTDAAPAVYASPGWLLFVRNGALMAQQFDADQLELRGEALFVTPPTNTAMVLGAPLSVSENGVLIWHGDRIRESQLVWFDRDGKEGAAVGPSLKVGGQYPRLSPDGKRVAIQHRDLSTQNQDIWVIDILRNLSIRLTSQPASDDLPIWSPDGSRVVFRTVREGAFGLYQKASSGLGAEELLLKGYSEPSDWSRDGRFIVYNRSAEKTRRDVWALPLIGSRQPYPLLNSEFDEYRAQLSPDGHWLAYISDESGDYEVYVQLFSADGKVGGDKKRISTSGGNHPRFRRDGQELFYVAADGQMMAVKIHDATFETPKALFKTRMVKNLVQSGIEYDVTSDGQRFLIGTQVGDARPVSVILNWTVGMKP